MWVSGLFQKGFTIIELMLVTAVIGVLAAVALPVCQDYAFRAKLSEMVLQLDNMADRVRLYENETGRYPDDTHIVPPADIAMPAYWYETTLLGGNYNWEGPDGYPYAGIAILGATASEQRMQYFDRLLDNGNLNTGKFRLTPNGRYTYILDE